MANENKPTLEDYFLWYVNELKEAGFIKRIVSQPFSIEVTPGMQNKRYAYSSTKEPQVEPYNLFRPNTYKCDWLIEWYPHAHEIFYNLLDGNPIRLNCPFYAMIDKTGAHITLTDVKPTSGQMIFGNNTTGYTFPIIQKILYSLYGIYVNKSIPIPMVQKGEIKSGNTVALFSTTFVPKRYMMTDSGSGQAREIHYRKQSLAEYVSYKTREIEKVNLHFNTQLTLL